MSQDGRTSAFDRFKNLTGTGKNSSVTAPTEIKTDSVNQNVPPANGGGEVPPATPPQAPLATGPSCDTRSIKSSRISQSVEQYLTDCDTQAHEGEALAGRDDDLARLSVLLTLKDTKNVLLTGPTGVGKSALVNHLLTSSATGQNISQDLFKRTFYKLDPEALLAGDSVVKINDAVKEIVTFLERRPFCVLVIDNAWNLINGMAEKGASSALASLMAAIGRRKFQTLMITASHNRAHLLATHPSFNELFAQIDLAEPNKDEVLNTLRGKRAYYQAHYRITINDDGLRTIAKLSDDYPSAYMGDLCQPGRAIRLLEFICAAYRNRFMSKSADLISLEAETKTLNLEKEALNGHNPARTQEINDRLAAIAPLYAAQKAAWDDQTKDIQSLTQEKKDAAIKLERAQEVRQSAHEGGDREQVLACDPHIEKYQTRIDDLNEKLGLLSIGEPSEHPLTRDKVLAIFLKYTGIDAAATGQDKLVRFMSAKERLGHSIMGQDQAIDVVSASLSRYAAGFRKKNRPVGSFFFLGPSGVGKTEIANALDQIVSGMPGSTPIRFDMGDYKELNAVTALIGPPPGYKDSDKGGQLTNSVRTRPNSVVLLDEIEKAHEGIFDIVLPILDNGAIKDRRGVETAFGNTIVIVTSNIGASYFLDTTLTFEEAQKAATDLLFKKIRPEILGRFNDIVFFKPLCEDAQFKIAQKFLCGHNADLEGTSFQMAMADETLHQVIARYYDAKIGGRSLRNVFEGPVCTAAANIINEENARLLSTAKDPSDDKGPQRIIDIGMTADGAFTAAIRPENSAPQQAPQDMHRPA